MASWVTKRQARVSVKSPILIEGLPGMGNVGKIAIDFLIDELGAKKVYEISSYDLPHWVFINEKNMVELPAIEVFHKRVGKQDFLFLSGDVQPTSESSCYAFCNHVLDTFEKSKGHEIITLGGIALSAVPEKPRVYCTGNSKQLIGDYQKYTSKKNLYNFIGPIVGVSGLLLGLASQRNIPAVTLLAETFGHPNYVGVEGAKVLVDVLKKRFNLKVDASKLKEEVRAVKKPVNVKGLGHQQKGVKGQKVSVGKKKESVSDPADGEDRMTYIG